MAGYELVEMSPSSSEKQQHHILLLEEVDASPLSISPIVCVKRKIDMKRFEETEDCFILDFDPSDPVSVSNLSLSENDDDVSIVSEKGQVACRDYPHPRHLCLKFPFGPTPCEAHCELCYCYVCDSVAPCGDWTESPSPHCQASGASEYWESKRRDVRKRRPVAHH